MQRVPWPSVCLTLLSAAAVTFSGRVASAQERAAQVKSRGLVALVAREPERSAAGEGADSKDSKKLGGKLLVRELLRQAVLIAARDQLGLATRDQTLRETIPASSGNVKVLDAETAELIGQSVRLKLTAGSIGRKKKIFEQEIPLPSDADTPFDYVALATAAESWSRTELVDALKQSGFEGRANRQSSEVKPTAETITRLNQLNFFSQFAAVRDLHELQRAQGESAETLGALVRAYANLGALTSFHWNASHKAFRARSLLYAQRLMRLDKQSAWAYRHRAYSLALPGMTAAALEDLKRADDATPAGKDSSDAAADTQWAPMIDAFCQFDLNRLKELKVAEDQKELLALLSYLAVENSGCVDLALARGRATLDVVPECYRVYDSMGRYKIVKNRSVTTTSRPAVLQGTLAIRMHDMPDLPASVDSELKKQLAIEVDASLDDAWSHGKQRLAIVKSLAEAGDPERDRQEPSWELVGRMLEDENFSQVYRRLELCTGILELPRDQFPDFVAQSLEAVGAHPYAAMLTCLGLHFIYDAEEIRAISDGLNIVDADLSMSAFANRTATMPPDDKKFGNLLWQSIIRHADDLLFDREGVLNRTKAAQDAHRLAKVSPRSPLAVSQLIELDPKFSTTHLEEWRKEHSQHPAVLRALAARYRQLNKLDDGAQCMEQYVKISPDQDGYARLAEIYWDQKATEKWIKTLETALTLDDADLGHARARVRLARHYLEQKDAKKALQYADAAVPSGVNWALSCAADCHEALEHWDEAEKLQRDVSLRYYNLQLEWYFWCRRTGHGDLAAAKAHALPAAKRMAAGKVLADQEIAGVFYLLADDKDAARAAFEKAMAQSSDPYAALHLSLMGDAAGDKVLRDKPLLQVAGKELMSTKAPQYIRVKIDLTKWLAKAYKQPADAEPDFATLDELLKTPAKQDQAILAHFMGQYFAQRKKPDLARKYFQRSAEAAGDIRTWFVLLGQVRNRELTEEAAKGAAKGDKEKK